MQKYEETLTDADYTHAQNCFIGEAICGNLLIKLTQGVFVTGFSKYIGLSDSLTGIIASIPILVGFLQIVGGLYFQSIKERKRKITLLMLLSRIALGLAYILPVLFAGTGIGKIVFISLYTLGYLLVALIGPVIVSWVFEMCPKNRSQYLSRREMIVMLVLGILEIPLGYTLDLFRDWQKEGLGFVVFGLITILVGVINLTLLRSIKERPAQAISTKKHLLQTVRGVSQNTNFRKLALLFGLWNFGIYFGNAYLFVYLLSKLKISYLFITCSTMICLAIRTLTVKRWAKLIEKKNWTYVARIGILIMAIATLLQTLLIRKTVVWLLPLIYLLSGTAWGAVAMTFFNLQVMFIPESEQTQYIGVFASINGLSGFCGTLLAALCIKLLRPYALEVFGITIANIQMLFMIAAFILLGCFIYTKLMIEPLEQQKNK
ncbi:MAG: MFS transporter [Cellulosilyticaceae bacterium]